MNTKNSTNSNRATLKNTDHGDRYAKATVAGRKLLAKRAASALRFKSDGEIAELLHDFVFATNGGRIAEELLRSAVARLARSSGGAIPPSDDEGDEAA